VRIQDAADQLSRMYQECGLDPETLDPWPAWKVFKAFLRTPVEAPDEGASVQYGIFEDDGEPFFFRLYWVRQFTELDADHEEVPLRRIVTELALEPERFWWTPDGEVWSYDFPSLSDFIAHVETDPKFQAAMNAPLASSQVYAEEL
jgi:hypothetical protein